MTAQQTMTVQQKKDMIQRLVNELHDGHREFQPMFPWVLLYVLPKAQTAYKGLLVLPEKQNKVTHEGIVLRTWKRHSEYWYDMQFKEEHRHFKESTLKPGDHVLFPHWAGLPIPGYDEGEYRIVKEEGWEQSKDGGIHSVVEYDGNSTTHDRLVNLMRTEPQWEEDIAIAIEQDFILIDRKTSSTTLSGK